MEFHQFLHAGDISSSNKECVQIKEVRSCSAGLSHELWTMSTELGPDFLRSLHFTHEQSASQPASGLLTLITTNYLDIFVSFFYLCSSAISSWEICFLWGVVFVCVLEMSWTPCSLTVNPAEDLLLCSHILSILTICGLFFSGADWRISEESSEARTHTFVFTHPAPLENFKRSLVQVWKQLNLAQQHAVLRQLLITVTFNAKLQSISGRHGWFSVVSYTAAFILSRALIIQM